MPLIHTSASLLIPLAPPSLSVHSADDFNSSFTDKIEALRAFEQTLEQAASTFISSHHHAYS